MEKTCKWWPSGASCPQLRVPATIVRQSTHQTVKSIAFVSNRDGKDGIWAVDEIGGAPVLRHSLERGSNTLVFWSDDSRRIYYDHNNSLRLLDLDSGATELVLEFPENRGMARDFAVSRDEDRVAYVDARNGQRDIWIYSRSQKQASRVTNDAASDSNPIWHPDGKRIIYNSIRDDISQPYVGFLNGRTPVRLVLLDADCVVNDISIRTRNSLLDDKR